MPVTNREQLTGNLIKFSSITDPRERVCFAELNQLSICRLQLFGEREKRIANRWRNKRWDQNTDGQHQLDVICRTGEQIENSRRAGNGEQHANYREANQPADDWELVNVGLNPQFVQ